MRNGGYRRRLDDELRFLNPRRGRRVTGFLVHSAASVASSKADAERLAGLLALTSPEPLAVVVEIGPGGAGEWTAACYFAEEPNSIELDLLAATCGCGPFAVSRVAETDWVLKVQEDHRPVSAGAFWIHGNHVSDDFPAGLIPIEIDRSLAFGTGHHETTQGCLKAMSGLSSRGFRPARVCDVGCGTGILAIAAVRLWGCAAIACDCDEDAVEVAIENAARNRVEGSVQLICCDGLSDERIKRGGPFDLIVANILSGPLVELSADLSDSVRKGGRLILSGLLQTEDQEIADSFERAGFEVSARLGRNDWLTLELVRCG